MDLFTTYKYVQLQTLKAKIPLNLCLFFLIQFKALEYTYHHPINNKTKMQM